MDNYHKGHRPDLQVRLDLLKEHIPEGSKVLDLGCSGGYYDFGLADQCSKIYAIDKEQDLIDQCYKEKAEMEMANVAFTCADFTQFYYNIGDFDVCLYMSIHHHIIQQKGLEYASQILKSLSEQFPMMFFDMGQRNENCVSYEWWKALPHTNNVQGWLEEYLKENTVYTKIEIIGGSLVHNIKRHFFKMEK